MLFAKFFKTVCVHPDRSGKRKQICGNLEYKQTENLLGRHYHYWYRIYIYPLTMIALRGLCKFKPGNLARIPGSRLMSSSQDKDDNNNNTNDFPDVRAGELPLGFAPSPGADIIFNMLAHGLYAITKKCCAL